MWQSLLAAFSLGFIGSMHCVGMCGPLLLALPVQNMDVAQRRLSVGLYHAGRIFVYALGGLLFGLLGRRVYLAGWQQGLSIVLGVLILAWVAAKQLYPAGRFSGGRNKFRLPPIGNKIYISLQSLIARCWRSSSRAKFLWMGMGNGLLPCGMVYLAIAGALTSTHVMQATAFMIFFGLGTLPMLLVLQMTGQKVSLSFRQQIRGVLPYLTAFMAILLILRGLNLGIPFISPVLGTPVGRTLSCH